ncbi:glycosyltransferase family 32 protein [Aeromicrobium sp. CF3.5]|uniref:glycosyltransferase family 32 protein n=1 Tax=Aeromicrobium sp. CF3.5 TaxID=3373078 RepID=UPI003EE741F0
MTDDLQATSAPSEDAATDDALRSEFIRLLIATEAGNDPSDGLPGSAYPEPISRAFLQFWDDLTGVPADVQECIDSWGPVEAAGFERVIFGDDSAADFIAIHLTPRHLSAFLSCGHPAMRADYFRLCFIAVLGGIYVDADDQLVGDVSAIPPPRPRLWLQPLCYDIASDSMLDPFEVAPLGLDPGRIFYVNNNPIVGPAAHPLIVLALSRATDQVLLFRDTSSDVQSLTGPGNLSACLVEQTLHLNAQALGRDFGLLRNWGSVARSVWPLEYRADDRNWRNWVKLT